MEAWKSEEHRANKWQLQNNGLILAYLEGEERMFSWLFSLFIYLSLKDREAMSADQDEASIWSGMWQGCGLALSCPQGCLHWDLKVYACGVHGAIHLWALLGTLKCVCHRCVFPPSLLKWWESDGWGGLRVGLCGPQGCTMGIFSLRGHEAWGVAS